MLLPCFNDWMFAVNIYPNWFSGHRPSSPSVDHGARQKDEHRVRLSEPKPLPTEGMISLFCLNMGKGKTATLEPRHIGFQRIKLSVICGLLVLPTYVTVQTKAKLDNHT